MVNEVFRRWSFGEPLMRKFDTPSRLVENSSRARWHTGYVCWGPGLIVSEIGRETGRLQTTPGFHLGVILSRFGKTRQASKGITTLTLPLYHTTFKIRLEGRHSGFYV